MSFAQERPAIAPYWGGKRALASWIDRHLGEGALYVEPFAGMLSVLLARQKAPVEMANDLNGDVVNWWRMVRDHPDELSLAIAGTPYSRAEFDLCVAALRGKVASPLERARAFHTMLTQSYGPSANAANAQWKRLWAHGVPAGWLAPLRPLAERLRGVLLECKPAVEILSAVEKREDAVLYVDPPYPSSDHIDEKYGACVLDVGELASALRAQRGRVALSGYGAEWDCLGWRKVEVDVNCMVLAGKADQTVAKRKEILWLNFDEPDDLFSLDGGKA